MSLIQIKQAVHKLSLGQLRKLDAWLHELIQKAEESAQAEETPTGKQIVEERTANNKTYRLELIRCGKEKCKCSRGTLHGPYWYSYWFENGRTRTQYIGKRLPAPDKTMSNDRFGRGRSPAEEIPELQEKLKSPKG